MRRMSAAAFLVLALSVFFATTTRADEQPVITQLVMRDRVITITSDSDGILYSISTKDGTVLEANLSEAQLQAKYPEVYDHVRPAIADKEVIENVIPWAGM